MGNIFNILIPDGESTWAINVVQCLGNDPKIRLYLLSGKFKTPVKYSKYITSYEYRPIEVSSEKRLDWINEAIDNHKTHIILPIAESISQLLIINKEKINPKAKVVELASIENFKTAIYKHLLYDFCLAHDIPTPKSVFLGKVEDLIQIVNNIDFPVLLKPINGKGGEGIVRFDSFETLNVEIGKYMNADGILIQELVDGYDIDCSVLCADGKILRYTIQKGFLKSKNPYAPQVGLEFLENDEVLNIIKVLMSALNWNGVAHIDLRYDKFDKKYKVLDLNARYWGSLIASKKVGVNFPYLIIQKTLGNPVSHSPFKHKKIVMLNGLIKHLAQNPLSIFSKQTNSRSTLLDVFFSDPKPHLFRFWEYIKRKF